MVNACKGGKIVCFPGFIPYSGIFFPPWEEFSFPAKYTRFIINTLGIGT
jgi:hypothetical protein